MERYGEMRIGYGLMQTNIFRYVRLRRRYGSMRTAIGSRCFGLFKTMAADAPSLRMRYERLRLRYERLRTDTFSVDRYGYIRKHHPQHPYRPYVCM
jgi:hypothetical protein